MAGADPRRANFGDFLRSRRERLVPVFGWSSERRRRRTAGCDGRRWRIGGYRCRLVHPPGTGTKRQPIAPRSMRWPARSPRQGGTRHLRALTRTARAPGVCPGERAGNDHAAGPEPQSAGLCHRAAVDVLAWNAAADDIFGFSRIAEEDRNTLVCRVDQPGDATPVRGPGPPRQNAWWRSSATLICGAGDPAFLDLLGRLRQGCAEFAACGRRTTSVRAAGQKVLKPPRRGCCASNMRRFRP